MANWQKKLAVLAAGSIVVGILTIAAGAMVGGVEDVNRIYLAPEKEPEVIKKEYDKISKLDLNLSAEHVLIEATDVEKVTVIETRGEREYSFSEQSAKDGVLNVRTFTMIPPPERHSINTDLFRILREMKRSTYSNIEPLRIQIPKDMVLDNILINSSVEVFLSGIKAKQLRADVEDAEYFSLSESVIDKFEGTVSGTFYVEASQIKGGSIKLNNLTHSHIGESKLENLTIEGSHDHMTFNHTLLKNTTVRTRRGSVGGYDDNQVYQDSGTGSYAMTTTILELLGVTFEGDVVIELADGSLGLAPSGPIDDFNLDLTANRGEIRVEVEDLPQTYVTDDIKSVYTHKGKNSKANVKVSVTNGNVSLYDWSGR